MMLRSSLSFPRVDSQLHPAYFYHLELSLSALQSYRITAFVNLWLSCLKHQNVENHHQQQHQQKLINKWLRKHHRYIGYIKIRSHRPSAPKSNSKFETFFETVFSLKQKMKSITPSYFRKDQILSLQQNSLWFL